MNTNSRHEKGRFKNAGRLLLAIVSFAVSFVAVSQTMLQFGTVPAEANAGDLICALATMAYVMYLPPRS